MRTHSQIRCLALALALSCVPTAWAAGPPTRAETLERVLSRLAAGDAQGAQRMLDEATVQGVTIEHGSVDVIRATSGDREAIERLIRQGLRREAGGEWLLLTAARGLATSHPIVATSLASTILSEAPAGRAARIFMVNTMDEMGARRLAAKTLRAGFGHPSRRLQGVPRRVLQRLEASRDPLVETERGWMWLDQGVDTRASAIFERALRRAKEPGDTRCWALAGGARAALREARSETGWRLLLEAFDHCADLPMAEENDVYLARMAFARGEPEIRARVQARIAARGEDRLRRFGLDVMDTLEGRDKGLSHVTRRLRERYLNWPFHDALTEVTLGLWLNYDKRRKHAKAVAMIQPLVDAGYVARRERSRGQLATCLARSYQRSGKTEMATKTLIHAAYHHPLTWYGILALEELRELAPFVADATEHTIPPAPHASPLEAHWDETPQLEALRERLVTLSSYGLADAVGSEAKAMAVEKHPGRAVWVSQLLLDMGAPREASQLAQLALEHQGVHSPLDGLGELWRLAYPRPFRSSVERHAEGESIDPHLAWAVMRIESRYATMATSYAGAKGLLQVMPGTAKWLSSLRSEKHEERDLFDPLRNIELGIHLLGRLRDRFDGEVPLMLVAYNAGSGRTRTWQRKVRAGSLRTWVERLPIAQARNYVRSVVSAWALYRYLDGLPTGLEQRPSGETIAQKR